MHVSYIAPYAMSKMNDIS